MGESAFVKWMYRAVSKFMPESRFHLGLGAALYINFMQMIGIGLLVIGVFMLPLLAQYSAGNRDFSANEVNFLGLMLVKSSVANYATAAYTPGKFAS